MSTVPVWVLLVVAIIGVAGPLGAQGIGWLIKRTELEEARQQRLRDERIKAYAELAQTAFARDTRDSSIDSEILASYSTIALVGESSKAILAAQKLCRQTLQLRDLARKVSWSDITEQRKGTPDPAYKEADAAVREAFKHFIYAARTDIGHSPEATEPIELMVEEEPDRGTPLSEQQPS